MGSADVGVSLVRPFSSRRRQIRPGQERRNSPQRLSSGDTINLSAGLWRRRTISHPVSDWGSQADAYQAHRAPIPLATHLDQRQQGGGDPRVTISDTSTDSGSGQVIPPQSPSPSDRSLCEVSSEEHRASRDDVGFHPSPSSSKEPNTKKRAQRLSASQIVRQLTHDCLFRNEFFQVRQSAVAGRGAFATQQLRRGDVILVEEPLFISNNFHLFADFEKLDRDTRRVALSLHKNERLKSDTPALSAVWKTNSFATNLRPGHAGLFAIAARFNHACHPAHNVEFMFDKAQGCLILTVRAEVVDVGTELTICYGETWTPDVLFLWYGFCCSCGACAGLTAEEVSALTPQW